MTATCTRYRRSPVGFPSMKSSTPDGLVMNRLHPHTRKDQGDTRKVIARISCDHEFTQEPMVSVSTPAQARRLHRQGALFARVPEVVGTKPSESSRRMFDRATHSATFFRVALGRLFPWPLFASSPWAARAPRPQKAGLGIKPVLSKVVNERPSTRSVSPHCRLATPGAH
jgi:hypothetical protein